MVAYRRYPEVASRRLEVAFRLYLMLDIHQQPFHAQLLLEEGTELHLLRYVKKYSND